MNKIFIYLIFTLLLINISYASIPNDLSDWEFNTSFSDDNVWGDQSNADYGVNNDSFNFVIKTGLATTEGYINQTTTNYGHRLKLFAWQDDFTNTKEIVAMWFNDTQEFDFKNTKIYTSHIYIKIEYTATGGPGSCIRVLTRTNLTSLKANKDTFNYGVNLAGACDSNDATYDWRNVTFWFNKSNKLAYMYHDSGTLTANTSKLPQTEDFYIVHFVNARDGSSCYESTCADDATQLITDYYVNTSKSITIGDISCTSCDSSTHTNDSTPTLKFNITSAFSVTCRVSTDNSFNWSQMGSERDCSSSGDEMTCTVISADKLYGCVEKNISIYCKNTIPYYVNKDYKLQYYKELDSSGTVTLPGVQNITTRCLLLPKHSYVSNFYLNLTGDPTGGTPHDVNVSIAGSTTMFNESGTFLYTNKTNDFSSNINTIINNGCSCNGCLTDSYYCKIPINFSMNSTSSGPGTINYTRLVSYVLTTKYFDFFNQSKKNNSLIKDNTTMYYNLSYYDKTNGANCSVYIGNTKKYEINNTLDGLNNFTLNTNWLNSANFFKINLTCIDNYNQSYINSEVKSYYYDTNTTLYLRLDGLEANRTYEYKTTANITSSYYIDIFDNTSRYINVSSLNYFIDTLRDNLVNINKKRVNLTYISAKENKSFNISLDARAKILNISFDLTGYKTTAYPQNINIYVNHSISNSYASIISEKNKLKTWFQDLSETKSIMLNEDNKYDSVNISVPKFATIYSAIVNITGRGYNGTYKKFDYFDNEQRSNSIWTSTMVDNNPSYPSTNNLDFDYNNERLYMYTSAGDDYNTGGTITVNADKSLNNTYIYLKENESIKVNYSAYTACGQGNSYSGGYVYFYIANSTYTKAVKTISSYCGPVSSMSNSKSGIFEINVTGSNVIGGNMTLRFRVSSSDQVKDQGWSRAYMYIYSIDYNYNQPYDVWFRIGNINNSKRFNKSGVFNTTNTTNNFATDITSYLVTCESDSNDMCNMPLYVYSKYGGNITLDNLKLNYTDTLSRFYLDKDLVQNYIDTQSGTVNLSVQIESETNGILEVYGIKTDFIGYKNITIMAHNALYTENLTRHISVYYSPFNISIIPQSIDYWNIGPNIYSYVQNEIPPFGNANGNGNPFWSIKKTRFPHKSDLYVYFNKSVNTCAKTRMYNSDHSFVVSTTKGLLIDNATSLTKEYNISTLTNISCGSINSTLLLPLFCFNNIASDAVRTSDAFSSCEVSQ